MALGQVGNKGWNPHQKQKWLAFNCLKCNFVFYGYPSSKRKYCSASCRSQVYGAISGKYLPHPKKELHHKWKGGITSEGRLLRVKFQKEVQPQVFVRDNYTCQICDEYGGRLQADHIKSWSEYPELRFELSNCRTLCMACHYYITFKRKIPIGIIWGHNLSRGIDK